MLHVLRPSDAVPHSQSAQGVGAISTTRNGPSWLALPARDAVGSVRVYDMHLTQSVVQAELRAHKTPLVRNGLNKCACWMSS